MNIFLIIYLLHVWSIITISANTEEAISRRDYDFMDLVAYDGYNAESHAVYTTDGYILTLYRVTSKNCPEIVGRTPIVWQHGMFLNGIDCIIPGPGNSHCYEYADQCMDVWVPNSRGTYYSRNHTVYDADTDSDFWDFSFEEMAQRDMPAVIDYVLEKTGKEQITFVGFAQGAIVLLNLCAAQPEYNKKVNVGIFMSMTAWLDNCRFIAIEAAAILAKIIPWPLTTVLNAEFLPHDGLYQPILKLLCGTTDLSYPGCSDIYFALLGNNTFQISMDTMKVMMGHIPGGTSVKNFLRWGQIKNNGFTQADFGSLVNLVKYGQLTPPDFDLSEVSFKCLIIGSENDNVANLTDVGTLMPKLSNSQLCTVSDKTFTHLDFVYGKDITKLITPMVLSFMNNGTVECL